MKKRMAKFLSYIIVVAFAANTFLYSVPSYAAPTDILSIGPEEIVYDAATLDAKGLGGWADSPLGVVANGSGGFDFYSSNGGLVTGTQVTTKTSGSLSDPAQTVVYNSKPIIGLPSAFGYAGVTFVYKDPGTGYLLGLVHLERIPLSVFWASVGLAISFDDGNTWNWRGEIIQLNTPYDPTSTTFRHEVGPGGYVLLNPPDDPSNQYFYIYTYDDINGSGPNSGDGTAVSRAKVADVISAAVNNTTPPTWKKYYGGVWTQSALGGMFTNISDDIYTAPDSISYNTSLNKYILASRDYSTTIGQMTLRTSSSPIDFKASSGAKKYEIISSKHNVYPTVIGLGTNPQTTSGATFYLYYLVFPLDEYWGLGTYMARREIKVKPSNVGTTYTASTGFSSTQGLNSWSYQAWNGSSYVDMTYDSANSRWKNSTYPNSLIGNNWQHPEQYDSVRVFKAPQSGAVTITGNVAKAAAGGDGVSVKITKSDGTQVWPETGYQSIAGNDATGFNLNLKTNLWEGENLYFHVNQNGTFLNDGTNWNPTITYVSSRIAQASAGFSSTQGSNEWNYQATNNGGSSYVNMTWSAANNSWWYNSSYSRIGSNYQHPDAYDSVRVYTAPQTGDTFIRTLISKSDWTGGDGVNAKIMKNGTQIWPASGWESIAYNENAKVNISMYVNQGDKIYFLLNKNSTNTNDTTYYDPFVIYK